MPKRRDSWVKGRIIEKRRDEFGWITVTEDEGTRHLCFGDGILQSSLSLESPGKIIEYYNQAMMSPLLFMEAPRSALLIGLGGCSLAHFLLEMFPGILLDAVEIRKEVIDLANEFFLLPKDTANLRVFHAAGQDFVRRQEGAKMIYDMVIVDAFDDSGPAAGLVSMSFYDGCRSLLAPSGICVVNLWQRPKDDFPGIYVRFREAFGGNVLRLFPDGKAWNAVLLGFTCQIGPAALASCRRKAKRLDQIYQVNLPKSLENICRHNFG